jgi:hypothetical protein
MTPREQIQNDIEEYLGNNKYFTAPYGIISGMESLGRGKVRTVTFGVARYLDATVYIYSPANIQVRGQGPLTYKFEGKFNSFLDFKGFMDEATKAKT